MKHNYSLKKTVPSAPTLSYAKRLFSFFSVLGFVLLLSLPGYAQSGQNAGWTLHSTKDGVSIYYKYAKCEQQDVVLFKLNNANKAAKEVSWKENFSLRGKEISVNDGQAKTMLVPVGESFIADCTLAENQEELLTPAYKYVSLLRKGVTGFEIYDFVVTSK